jgi:hypothetical protein
MSAKVIPCECPICEKVFMARHNQMNSAIASGREVPTCSRKCEQERRYAAIRDAKWKAEQSLYVNVLTAAN